MAAIDHQTMQMNQFKSYVTMSADPSAKEDSKLKAAQEISENFEFILASPHYVSFLNHSIPIFMSILSSTEPLFIAEYNMQQIRKLILEMIYRLPTSEALRKHVGPILTLMLKLLEVDNEVNVSICLKIIIELHKFYRPVFNGEIQHFLNFVKTIYSDSPSHMNRIFEPKAPIKVSDSMESNNLDDLLQGTFTMTTIQTEQRKEDGSFVAYYLIPRSVLSLKVLQESPIIVVSMYQLYKKSVHQDVADFIPLIMSTITLQPTLEQRQSETFNKEIFVDFMGAQVKTLSFLAYIIKIYQDVVQQHAQLLVQGMLGSLTLCPMEVAHSRRESSIAARHILATDLRNKFVPYMDRLFDEEILLGRGWTTHESSRPLAYSTLADLVHHVRQQLSFTDLISAIHLFSKNVHDDTLAATIQTMSCKLLLNLVECVRVRSEAENKPEGRELLIRMLEVFVLKFKTVSKIQLPILVNKCKTSTGTPQVTAQQQVEVKTEPDQKVNTGDLLESSLSGSQGTQPKEERSKFGLPQSNNYNVSDYRSSVKTLVCGVKTITWGCSSFKANSAGVPFTTPKYFYPNETLVYVRLVRWALKALDIYTLPGGPQAGGVIQRINQQNMRTKEEKEVLEHFSGVFSMMNTQTFHEIFSTTIEYLVERVYKNPTSQTIPNTLLANPQTSPIFATVLVEYLLERMEEMGSNLERSNLYSKLFKLVFGSVSLFPTENENMLRPHLHQIVNRSMELAMSAKEPYNYFLSLRALFRSIGGGSHDLLYQEFLPLLPNLLEGSNRSQSGLHKQHMKDLFVELCLTVPVRLSSSLPYLPMSMDPLVSASNGSPVLVSQGSRTLELCVDNSQHDFLYEHIQPVRADLMQALWRTSRNNDSVAFKVLGKFGGGNRKMMIEPQKLEYISSDFDPPAIKVSFIDYHQPIHFPVQKIIETAFNASKQSNTDSFYRKQAWDVINCYLMASTDLADDRRSSINLFMHPSFQDPSTIPDVKGSTYKSIYKQARETHQTALTGMYVAAAIKELRERVVPAMVSIVRHYTMVAVAQQAGMFANAPKPNEQIALDPLVLIDALAVIMGHEEKESCKPGHVGMVLIVDTASTLLGSKEAACKLPMIEYMAEKMCASCYERAWYAKLGGCIAIKFMFESCAAKWVYEHMFTFLKALLFVMMDSTGEVSSGALDMAKNNLEKMSIVCVSPPPPNADQQTKELQRKALYDITHELVIQVTSTYVLVREQAMRSLRSSAEKQNKSVTEVMEPFKSVLADMVPPKKHLLRHQSAIAQMGLMDGNYFCNTLNPRSFTINMSIKEHNLFITDLLSICNTEDTKLNSFSCYKSMTNFIPLRRSALRVLASCHYSEELREQIFQVLYKALEQPNAELQETAFECMKQFIAGYPVEKELVHPTVRPLLMTLGDVKNLTLNGVKMSSYLTQLFPLVFNEKLCEQLSEISKQLLDNLINHHKNSNGVSKKGEEEQKIVTIISIFHQTPAASSKFITLLVTLISQTEKAMSIEASSPFREVLMKFLSRYPSETLEMLMTDAYVQDRQFNRFSCYSIKHKDGKPFRDHLQNNMVNRSIVMASFWINQSDRLSLQYHAVRIVSLSIKHDDQWSATQQKSVETIKQIWCDDSYQERHQNVVEIEVEHWKEPKLLVKISSHYFCHYPNDIDSLFQSLRATCDRFIPTFQFLRDFLENTVAQNYTVEWKRTAFFRFVESFPSRTMSQESKAKVSQLIIIPCFGVCFERGETNKLIGSPPMPYQENPDNVVSVFINKSIDPDNPFPSADCVRISLSQFSCMLFEQASSHFHDPDSNTKTQGYKLRRSMTFAWPCLSVENCVDPATRYHGHLSLSHIIYKYKKIHKKIVLQVFHSLLKAHAVEARGVVRQALDILTPSVPLRIEEGSTMLIYWTKKIIVDEGHSMQQLFHILQLVVKHHKVYYPLRHHIVQYMVNSIQRLGFSPTATSEHRKLGVELAEVIIKWELYGIKEEESSENGQVKRPIYDDNERKKLAISQPSTSSGASSSVNKTDAASRPIDRIHVEAVFNFLIKSACTIHEVQPPNQTNSLVTTPVELSGRRCVSILRSTLKPDLWSIQINIKVTYLDDCFAGVDVPNPNWGNILTGLEVSAFLVGALKKEQVSNEIRSLQRGLTACIMSTNSKVIKLMHSLSTKLMSVFPTERTNSTVSCKYEELDVSYTTVGKVIYEGLSNYEKNTQANPTASFGTIMSSKAACASNHSYIDLLITPFMRVLHRSAKEHLQPTSSDYSTMTSELLILSLDLVKTRVVVMGVEMRKTFIGNISVGSIEKTQDLKVIKAIIKMSEEWMKCKSYVTSNQAPSSREKSILLVKMMQYVEKRFNDDVDIMAQFLDSVLFVYTDPALKQTELTSKSESAFLSGLRCSQPLIRARFFRVFDESIKRRLYERILYIVCSQNWDAIGPHYWIKQAIESSMVTVSSETPIEMSHESSILPNITSAVFSANTQKKEEFIRTQSDNLNLGNMMEQVNEEILEVDLNNVEGTQVEEKPVNRAETVSKMIKKHFEFIEVGRNITTDQFLLAATQLCHLDTNLAEQVWLNLFPKSWTISHEDQRYHSGREINAFVISGAHLIQKDCQPSAVNTFVEASSRCTPSVQLPPASMRYLGKSYNSWHRMALGLEQMCFDPNAVKKIPNPKPFYDFENETTVKGETLEALADLYNLSCEEDQWAGSWQKHAHYKETSVAIAYEQHGFFEQAQAAYEAGMMKYKQDSAAGPVSVHSQRELLMWNDRWVRCMKEQNQWEGLKEYAKSGAYDPFSSLEASWRIPQWDVVKEVLTHVEYQCPKELAWKMTMYGGYSLICQPDESKPLKFVERYVENATALCLNEWKRLPHIVSHIHLNYLQAAQQIMELQEAYQIHKGLSQAHQNSLHDMKAIVKTWRNRLPVIADDSSHWNDIITWRQHHYQAIVNHYETARDTGNANSMLGVHASAQAIIHFGKIARKHKMPNVCLETLNKIYTIPSVPIIDCYQKIRQEVKSYSQIASSKDKSEHQEILPLGLEVINNTNIQFFAKEMTAEFYALKGILFHSMNKSDDANKCFSAAIQLHDSSIKAWALYGDYLEAIFTRDQRQMSSGVNAMVCFSHACRHQNEAKSRKYMAKVLWLLSYDDKTGSLMEALEKFGVGILPILWLPWTPQLSNCLVQYEGNTILNILCQVGRMFPQAVYFPIRILYLTLRRATARETCVQQHSQDSQSSEGQSGASQEQTTTSNEASSIKATPAMIRCSKIMKMQKDFYPIVSLSLEGIADQMEWFRENWYEEVLRQLRQGLAKCYAIAFENRDTVSDAKITPHILNFVRKLVSTFGIGVENISSSVNVTFHSAASESLARRAEATYQDPVFKEMKQEFTKDFDFSQPNSMRLHNSIFKLKKWIKILDARAKMLLQSFSMEDKCRFSSLFSLKTAEVELPGEFLLPKHNHYFVRITRFMPRVDVVQKHNCSARRLYIRGHNGKIYPYLVVNDSGLADARREERVLQLLRMMNNYSGKQKETSRRFLNFTIPRVVAVSQQIRSVEDNPSSISSLDIYKSGCAKMGLDFDKPINYYYERLAGVQSRGIKASHQVYRDILKGVQSNMVPRTSSKQWALRTFPSATDYWQFRKMFTLQLALACFAEYVFHSTRLNPDMMYSHQDSGLMNIAYFKFDVDDSTGDLDTTRPVPFRSTPNIIEFLNPVGISGPLTASMIAAARCFVYPNFKIQNILKPISKDEMILSRMKKSEETPLSNKEKIGDSEQIINMVNRAVTSITNRSNTLAHFEGVDSRLATLVAAASSHDNLCRMDPAWHPWL